MGRMNKKGSVLMILIAIAFFMFAMIFMNFIMDEVTRAMDSDNLNCDSPNTDGDKIVCLVADVTIPAFIIVVLGITGAYAVGRYMR